MSGSQGGSYSVLQVANQKGGDPVTFDMGEMSLSHRVIFSLECSNCGYWLVFQCVYI